MQVVQPLFEGLIDIVGDVHGEVTALNNLLSHLGYDHHGSHPSGRRLVFVGDLVDRGPDSPAVVEKVMKLVERGVAQCILGNHELNILLDDPKHGSEWFFQEEVHDGPPMRSVKEDEKKCFLDFFHSLPLALERDDLRVVHACWHAPSLDELESGSHDGKPSESRQA